MKVTESGLKNYRANVPKVVNRTLTTKANVIKGIDEKSLKGLRKL